MLLHDAQHIMHDNGQRPIATGDLKSLCEGQLGKIIMVQRKEMINYLQILE